MIEDIFEGLFEGFGMMIGELIADGITYHQHTFEVSLIKKSGKDSNPQLLISLHNKRRKAIPLMSLSLRLRRGSEHIDLTTYLDKLPDVIQPKSEVEVAMDYVKFVEILKENEDSFKNNGRIVFLLKSSERKTYKIKTDVSYKKLMKSDKKYATHKNEEDYDFFI